MDNTISVSNMDRPAPKWYRKFSTYMIVFIIPGVILLINGWGLPIIVVNHWLLILAFVSPAIKGFGIFFGNGQEFTESTDYKLPTDLRAQKP